MTWYDDKEEKIIRTITVQFDSYSVPTLPEVLLALRDKAFQEGQAAKISEIKGALHISDRTPSMFDRIG